MKIRSFIAKCLILSMSSVTAAHAQNRIVSLDGGLSEMLCALGQEAKIVGVDITSNYPSSLKSKKQVGHNRNISAEGVLSLNPDMVVGIANELNTALPEQLKAKAGLKLAIYPKLQSVADVHARLNDLAALTGTNAKAKIISANFDKQMAAIGKKSINKKVLFIYARGAGTMFVAGRNTPIDQMITMAGAKNAASMLTDYKPLTAEALVAAQPDVILLFTSGLESVGGIDGLLKIPGIISTPAGQNRKIVNMDGELLSGFSLRLPVAIKELQSKIAR